MMVLIVVMALSMVVPAFAAGDTWIQKANIPTASKSLTASGLDGKVYVMGGWYGSAPNVVYSKLVYMYDPSANTWTPKKSMPYGVADASSITVNGLIYVIGGLEGGVATNRVQVYDPSSDSWVVKANMPSSRATLGLGEVNGVIYAIGGSAPSGKKIEAYNPTTDTWTIKTDLSVAINKFATAVVNGKIYVIGGEKQNVTNEVTQYDPVTDLWSIKTSLPIPNLTHITSAASSANGKIYVVGGTASGNVSDKLFEYDPSSDNWTTKASMPQPSAYLASTTASGKLYAISGSGSNSGGFSSSVFEYTLSETQPLAPLNLTASSGNAQVTLNWTAVVGATGYDIKRSTTTGGPYTTVATNVYGTSYIDTTVTNGTTYYYVVTAINAAGVSGNSNEASATPQGTVTPPTGNKALLVITLVSGLEKEYDLPMTEVNNFITWYNSRATGTGSEVFTINKSFNKANFLTRKDYIAFDKIETFEVNEYTPTP